MPVKSFDTAQELFDYLEQMHEDDARALEESKIKPEDVPVGQCFVRLYPSGHREYLMIFGEATRSKYPEDWPFEEDARMRGHIPGMCYSVQCPDGELGNTHVANIHALITRETFETAKANGWRHMNRSN